MNGPRVRTYLVRGGGSCTLAMPGNMTVAHEGGFSLWALVLDDDGARQAEEAIRSVGATFTVTSDTENAEQVEERRALFAALDPRDLPTSACPLCFWLDPMGTQRCGRRGWPAEQVQAALDAHEKARNDAEACPLNAQT